MKPIRRGLFGMLAGLFASFCFGLALYGVMWPFSEPKTIDIHQFHIVGAVDVTGINGVCAEGDQLTVWIAGKPGRLWTCTADEFSWMKEFDVVADYEANPTGVEGVH